MMATCAAEESLKEPTGIVPDAMTPPVGWPCTEGPPNLAPSGIHSTATQPGSTFKFDGNVAGVAPATLAAAVVVASAGLGGGGATPKGAQAASPTSIAPSNSPGRTP